MHSFVFSSGGGGVGVGTKIYTGIYISSHVAGMGLIPNPLPDFCYH